MALVLFTLNFLSWGDSRAVQLETARVCLLGARQTLQRLRLEWVGSRLKG